MGYQINYPGVPDRRGLDRDVGTYGKNNSSKSTASDSNVKRSKVENWGATRQTGAQIGLHLTNAILNPIAGICKLVIGIGYGTAKLVTGYKPETSGASDMMKDGLNQIVGRPIAEFGKIGIAVYNLGNYAFENNFGDETERRNSFQRIAEKSTESLSFQENSSLKEAGMNYTSNLFETRKFNSEEKININDYKHYKSRKKGREGSDAEGLKKYSFTENGKTYYVDKENLRTMTKSEIDKFNLMKERNSKNAFKNVQESSKGFENEKSHLKAKQATEDRFKGKS